MVNVVDEILDQRPQSASIDDFLQLFEFVRTVDRIVEIPTLFLAFWTPFLQPQPLWINVHR